MVQMSALLKYASYGGVLCVSAGTAYQFQITYKLRKIDYFKEAMVKLENHNAAGILGEPIKPGYVDLFSGRSYADDETADIYVNVKGSKTKGELYLKAIKNLENGSWLLKRVELEIKDEFGGKLLIFEDQSEGEEQIQINS